MAVHRRANSFPNYDLDLIGDPLQEFEVLHPNIDGRIPTSPSFTEPRSPPAITTFSPVFDLELGGTPHEQQQQAKNRPAYLRRAVFTPVASRQLPAASNASGLHRQPTIAAGNAPGGGGGGGLDRSQSDLQVMMHQHFPHLQGGKVAGPHAAEVLTPAAQSLQELCKPASDLELELSRRVRAFRAARLTKPHATPTPPAVPGSGGLAAAIAAATNTTTATTASSTSNTPPGPTPGEIEALAFELQSEGFLVQILDGKRVGPKDARSCLRTLKHRFLVCLGRGAPPPQRRSLQGNERRLDAAGQQQGQQQHLQQQYQRLSEPLVVEIRFREQFLIANPSRAYEHLLLALPVAFVGPWRRLDAAVELMAGEVAAVFRQANRPLPPWRTKGAMLSKWAPSQLLELERMMRQALLVQAAQQQQQGHQGQREDERPDVDRSWGSGISDMPSCGSGAVGGGGGATNANSEPLCIAVTAAAGAAGGPDAYLGGGPQQVGAEDPGDVMGPSLGLRSDGKAQELMSTMDLGSDSDLDRPDARSDLTALGDGRRGGADAGGGGGGVRRSGSSNSGSSNSASKAPRQLRGPPGFTTAPLQAPPAAVLPQQQKQQEHQQQGQRRAPLGALPGQHQLQGAHPAAATTITRQDELLDVGADVGADGMTCLDMEQSSDAALMVLMPGMVPATVTGAHMDGAQPVAPALWPGAVSNAAAAATSAVSAAACAVEAAVSPDSLKGVVAGGGGPAEAGIGCGGGICGGLTFPILPEVVVEVLPPCAVAHLHSSGPSVPLQKQFSEYQEPRQQQQQQTGTGKERRSSLPPPPRSAFSPFASVSMPADYGSADAEGVDGHAAVRAVWEDKIGAQEQLPPQRHHHYYSAEAAVSFDVGDGASGGGACGGSPLPEFTLRHSALAPPPHQLQQMYDTYGGCDVAHRDTMMTSAAAEAAPMGRGIGTLRGPTVTMPMATPPRITPLHGAGGAAAAGGLAPAATAGMAAILKHQPLAVGALGHHTVHGGLPPAAAGGAVVAVADGSSSGGGGLQAPFPIPDALRITRRSSSDLSRAASKFKNAKSLLAAALRRATGSSGKDGAAATGAAAAGTAAAVAAGQHHGGPELQQVPELAGGLQRQQQPGMVTELAPGQRDGAVLDTQGRAAAAAAGAAVGPTGIAAGGAGKVTAAAVGPGGGTTGGHRDGSTAAVKQVALAGGVMTRASDREPLWARIATVRWDQPAPAGRAPAAPAGGGGAGRRVL